MNKQLTGKIGKTYLQTKVKQFESLLPGVVEKSIKEAKELGTVPEDLISRFVTMMEGGKKIRAALMVLGYELAGGKDHDAINSLSLFLEVFHAGLLVHDDIMDQDALRRGKESLHIQYMKVGQARGIQNADHYGRSFAIDVGDLAFYLSWRILLTSAFPVEKVMDVARLYATCGIRLSYGQGMDIYQYPVEQLHIASIMKTFQLKTAEYTGVFPLEAGATLAGMQEDDLRALRAYGLAFGWAFQIQDDILGIFGSEQELGKPVGSDIREKKNTLLMLALLKKGSADQRKKQRALLAKNTITLDDVEQMRELLLTSGAYADVIRQGHEQVAEACRAADALQIADSHRELLKSLAVFMMERVA